MTMMDAIAQQGPTMKIWLVWMFLANFSSLAFVKNHVSARWVLAAMVGNLIGMNLLLRNVGPGPLTSIPHILLWTPLMVYLAIVWKKTDRKTVFLYWLSALIMTDSTSLILDYRAMVLHLRGGGE